MGNYENVGVEQMEDKSWICPGCKTPLPEKPFICPGCGMKIKLVTEQMVLVTTNLTAKMVT